MIGCWIISSIVIVFITFIVWCECECGNECFVLAIGSLATLLGPISAFIVLLGGVFFLLYQIAKAWKQSYERVCEKFKELEKK